MSDEERTNIKMQLRAKLINTYCVIFELIFGFILNIILLVVGLQLTTCEEKAEIQLEEKNSLSYNIYIVTKRVNEPNSIYV